MENKNSKTGSFVIILSLALSVGCTRTVYEPVVRSERVVDTVTQTVADSAVLRALFECDSLGNVRLRELYDAKGKMAQVETHLSGGELQVVTRWQTKYVDRVREVHDTTTVVQLQEITREERYVPAFFWWCFAVALGCVGGGIWKLWRRFA